MLGFTTHFYSTTFATAFACVALFATLIRKHRLLLYKLFGTHTYTLGGYVKGAMDALPLAWRHGVKFDWDWVWRHLFFAQIASLWRNVIKGPPSTRIQVGRAEESKTRPYVLDDPKRYYTVWNLGSYNYLGQGGKCLFGTEAELEELVCGSRSAALKKQQALEDRIAAFLGKDRSFILPTGYGTNVAVIPRLIDAIQSLKTRRNQKMLVLSDELNHASLVRGMRMAKSSVVKVFPHNDFSELERIIVTHLDELTPDGHAKRFGAVMIFVEGLYSMEGDIPDLDVLVSLKKRLSSLVPCYLYVDEAHSFGSMGQTGRGICEETQTNPKDVDFLMGTMTKFSASIGGYVSYDESMTHIMHLVIQNVYQLRHRDGTVVSPIGCTLQTTKVLEKMEDEQGQRSRIKRLRANTHILRNALSSIGIEVMGHPNSPVIPFLVPDPTHLKPLSDRCLELGLGIIVVCYPATPVMRPRARLCASAGHTEEQVNEMASIVVRAIEEIGVLRPANASSHTKLLPMESPKQTTERVETPLTLAHRQHDSHFEVERERKPWEYDRNAFVERITQSIQPRELPPRLHEPVKDIVRKEGVGTSGPRGFFGTTSHHVDLENTAAETYGYPSAILYPTAMFMASGLIPALLGKRNRRVYAETPRGMNVRPDISMGCAFAKAKLITFTKEEFDPSVPWDMLITCSIDFSLSAEHKRGIWIQDECESSLGSFRRTLCNDHGDVHKVIPDGVMVSLEREIEGLGGIYCGSSECIDGQRINSNSYVFSASPPMYLCELARQHLINLLPYSS